MQVEAVMKVKELFPKMESPKVTNTAQVAAMLQGVAVDDEPPDDDDEDANYEGLPFMEGGDDDD